MLCRIVRKVWSACHVDSKRRKISSKPFGLFLLAVSSSEVTSITSTISCIYYHPIAPAHYTKSAESPRSRRWTPRPRHIFVFMAVSMMWCGRCARMVRYCRHCIPMRYSNSIFSESDLIVFLSAIYFKLPTPSRLTQVALMGNVMSTISQTLIRSMNGFGMTTTIMLINRLSLCPLSPLKTYKA